MATIMVRFNGGNAPVVTGGVPPNAQTPIQEPTDTGFAANQAFILEAGEYCFGLKTSKAYTPLWRVVQAVDGQQATIVFRTVP